MGHRLLPAAPGSDVNDLAPLGSEHDEHVEMKPCRIPHPRECRPRRPVRTPAWEPNRDRRDAGRPHVPRQQLEGWHSPVVEATSDLGQVRINFNYRNYFTITATYGEKSRRAHYFEGPHELNRFRQFEMDTNVIDYQFQPLHMRWTKADGQSVVYTTDAIYSTVAGEIVVEEVKATKAYFDRSDTHDLLKLFETEIKKVGARFDRIAGNCIAEPTFLRTIKDAFDNRRTAYHELDVERARDVIARAGGTAPLGIVLEAVGGPGREALAKLHAMMVRREVAIDLTKPPMGYTLVTLPKAPTDPDALRAFLRRFSVQP